MKPMNAQDRPKVIALGALTVVMLGFFAKTMLGMVASKDAPAPAPAQPAPVAPPVAVATPVTGATTTVPGGQAKPTLASMNSIEMGGPTDPFRRVLPDPGKFSNPGPPPVASNPRPGGSGLTGQFPTGKQTGIEPWNPTGKVAAVPLGPPIKLEGVVSERENYAMVTVGPKTEMYRAGSKIANFYEVISIDEYGASFRGPAGTFRLEVGQEHTPAAAPAVSAPTGNLGGLPLPLSGISGH